MTIGDVGPTHRQRTCRLVEVVRPNKTRHRVRLQIDAAHLHVKTQRTSRRGKPWRLLRMSSTRIRKRPRRGRAPRPFVSETTGWGRGDRIAPAEVLALGAMSSGGLLAAISLDLWRALRLRLCGIADGLGQYLVQLRLGLGRGPFGWLPLGHGAICGDAGAELHPNSVGNGPFPTPAG